MKRRTSGGAVDVADALNLCDRACYYSSTPLLSNYKAQVLTGFRKRPGETLPQCMDAKL